MKVLIAVDGPAREGDEFHWTTAGELVSPGFICDSDASPARRGRKGGCGCSRSFSGFDSRKSGTTAMVVDRDDLDNEGLAGKWLESMTAGGWTLGMSVAMDAAAEIVQIAERFDEGDLIVRDFDDYRIKES